MSIENVSNNYIIANKLKFNVSGATKKDMLYKQFVAWNCNSCSIAQFTDYTNNPVYQLLPLESDYFTSTNEQVYLDLLDNKGYTSELEKMRQNDTDLVLKIKSKECAEQKDEIKDAGIFAE